MKPKSIYPAYFLFRWICVLLTMIFTLPDKFRPGDSALSLDLNQVRLKGLNRNSIEQERVEFVIDFKITMLT